MATRRRRPEALQIDAQWNPNHRCTAHTGVLLGRVVRRAHDRVDALQYSLVVASDDRLNRAPPGRKHVAHDRSEALMGDEDGRHPYPPGDVGGGEHRRAIRQLHDVRP